MPSPSREAAVVARLTARDLQTNLGSNLALIREETNLDPWEMDKALQLAERQKIPQGNEWRSEYLWKLLNQKLAFYIMTEKFRKKKMTLELISSLIVN